ncbi:MAG: GNAT family N-acetyltransferase [Erysipelotrichaceae bacterium]|nr:GNAT family N-acetyltransferase [Erysipelotrichaceae bacterium]
MRIETPRLLLRPFEMSDLRDVHEYCRQPGIGEMAGWKHHPTLNYTRGILLLWIIEGCRFAVVYKPENRVIGHVTVNYDNDGDKTVRDLGFVLNRDYHHQGIMSEIAVPVIEELKKEGIRRLTASCYQDNENSRRLLERIGFHLFGEGKFYSYGTGLVEDTYLFRMDLVAREK